MKLLLLNGHGIKFKIEKAKLIIKDGRYFDNEPEEYIFRPKRIPYDNIVIYGQSGEISIEAMRWLIKHNVTITLLNWDGKLLTTMLPQESLQVKTKFAQYSAYRDSSLRLEIAKKIIEGKIARSKIVLEWLKLRYPNIEYNFTIDEERLDEAETIGEIIRAEARIAKIYWKNIKSIFPEKYEFEGRNNFDRPFGAGDMINCMLNYGYAILESECLRSIYATGLDSHVGFLHEMRLGKNSLAYDLQEPFRFLIDLAVISLIDKKLINAKNFIRTENYNLRLRATGAKRLLEEIQTQFNQKVLYQKKKTKWGSVLMLQTRELAQFLLGEKAKIDFVKPLYMIERDDTEEMRQIIKDMSYYKWKKLGYSKGTLHPLKQKVKNNEQFLLNKHVKGRLIELKNE